jgi:3-deoxy-D-manno-octulosonic-acid transferase
MLVESEFWPNLILRSRSRGMQLVLINGRMSERSHGRWQMAGASARKVFESFDLAFASNEDQVARMGSLGVSPVECVGNIKLAAPALSIDDAALSELRDIAMDRPVWIAASTHAGEEEAVLAAHHQVRQRHPDALCIIIPRHPDRGPGIAELTAAAGHTVARRAAGEMPDAGHAVYVADTMGEMGVFFALASVVFVAGSLVPVGGHNPVEPAHFDTAVLIGPLMSKNIEIAQEFLARGGALEVTADTLGAQVTELLANPERRTELADAARTIAQDHMGVLDLVMDRLAPLLAAAKR